MAQTSISQPVPRSAPTLTRLSHFAVPAALVLPGMLSYLPARFRTIHTTSDNIVLFAPDMPPTIHFLATKSGRGNEAASSGCSRSYHAASKFDSIGARIGDSETLRKSLYAVCTVPHIDLDSVLHLGPLGAPEHNSRMEDWC